MINIDQSIPAFGGFFVDRISDTFVLSVTDASRIDEVRAAFDSVVSRAPGFFANDRGSRRIVVTRIVSHRISELVGYQRLAERALARVRGVTFTDADESANTVRIGVSNSAVVSQAARALSAAGIPPTVVRLAVAEPWVPAASVRDRFRPTGGGIQISFQFGGLCTLGYNVTASDGARYALTNSHCTGSLFGGTGQPTYQATVAGANLIGSVTANPAWTLVDPGCLGASLCRRSDAALIQYQAGISAPARIPNVTVLNSLTFSNWAIPIDNLGNAPYVGQTLRKVGRTSGFSMGAVTGTCVNLGPSTDGNAVVCSDEVAAFANFGDSGSPVFWWGAPLLPDRRMAMGILFGFREVVPGNRSFVFSRWSQIESDLGSLAM